VLGGDTALNGATVTVARADPQDDVRRAGGAADRAGFALEDATVRARTAARKLGMVSRGLPPARHRVADARGRVIAAQVLANSARRQARAAKARYAVVKGRAELGRRRVHEAVERVNLVVASSYKGSRFAAINIISGATGPQDALDRMGYVGRVMENQQADVDELAAARSVARAAAERTAVARRIAARAERAARQRLEDARQAQEEAVRARTAVLALVAGRRRALGVARSERGAVLARYQRLKAEEARIAAALREYGRRRGGAVTTSLKGGGRLLMPVNGWKTSDFGMRLNPVYRVWRLHAGTDFAAGGGSPIRAAADGRVVTAGWSGGYGNFTCVSHGRYQGRGMSTCYGHQSVIEVGSGQYVRRGQVIGRVGSTGASTGFHLHFEVRLDGEPLDPTVFLPACLC
jgi:murein DD-endopeptidase MepM/ murein hydrolase activator NlpD